MRSPSLVPASSRSGPSPSPMALRHLSPNHTKTIATTREKITIRRSNFFDKANGMNFYYVHSALEKSIGKIISVVKLDGIVSNKNDDIGNKIAMHIAASNPLSIDKDDIDKKTVDKELEIIKEEIINSGKPAEIADKISKGKISKFLNVIFCVQI